jgi:hypothetical protein
MKLVSAIKMEEEIYMIWKEKHHKYYLDQKVVEEESEIVLSGVRKLFDINIDNINDYFIIVKYRKQPLIYRNSKSNPNINKRKGIIDKLSKYILRKVINLVKERFYTILKPYHKENMVKLGCCKICADYCFVTIYYPIIIDICDYTILYLLFYSIALKNANPLPAKINKSLKDQNAHVVEAEINALIVYFFWRCGKKEMAELLIEKKSINFNINLYYNKASDKIKWDDFLLKTKNCFPTN